MKNLRIPLSVWTAGLTILTTTGCKTVVRENIISHINTGIGISLTENPKTELYEVKAGFIRTQFYSVPTGKTVESEREDGSGASNAANLTPEVVSGIRAHSGAQHLFLGMDVMENFAVGKVAVMSPAAVAMYISTARDAERAKAAAEGASSALSKLGVSPGVASVETMDGVIAFLKGLPEGDYPKKKAILASLATTGDLAPQWDFDRYAWQTVNSALMINDPGTATLPSGYDRFKTYRGTLQQSINVLESASKVPNIRNLQVKAGAGAVTKISDTQIVKTGSDLESQKSKLRILDSRFAEHPAVIKALDYFASIVKQ